MHGQAQEQLSDADWREGESRKEVVRMHSHILALRSALKVTNCCQHLGNSCSSQDLRDYSSWALLC